MSNWARRLAILFVISDTFILLGIVKLPNRPTCALILLVYDNQSFFVSIETLEASVDRIEFISIAHYFVVQALFECA